MYFSATCISCITEKNEHRLQEYFLELRDDRLYALYCELGHETIVILNNDTYELLFDLGMHALADEYNREAITNFAATVERFHEFCLAVFVKDRMLAEAYSTEYPKSWKEMARQSERQLGGYIAMYLTTFKRAPELLSKRNIELRNDVTHKGKFPTFEEAHDYAKEVFLYIHKKLIELKEALPDSVEFAYDKKLRSYLMDNRVNGKMVKNWQEGTIFQSLQNIDDIQRVTFDDAYKRIKSIVSKK